MSRNVYNETALGVIVSLANHMNAHDLESASVQYEWSEGGSARKMTVRMTRNPRVEDTE